MAEKVEHFSGIKIGKDVKIDANSCTDRGTIDDTVIGENAKINNFVHIAHNATIAKSVCIVAGTVICESTKLNDGAYIAPGEIVKNQLEIGNDGFAGLSAVITKFVKDEELVIGVSAKPVK